MDKDTEYRKMPYVFYKSRNDYESQITEGNIGPWYYCNIIRFEEYDGGFDKITSDAIFIARWWNKNKTDNGEIYYLDHRLAFNDEKTAAKFQKWYAKLDHPLLGYRRLWLAKKDLMKIIEKTGTVHIVEKMNIENELFDSYNDERLSEEIYDLYWWMQENFEGEVYYWNGTLYFASGADAMAFKLKWT